MLICDGMVDGVECFAVAIPITFYGLRDEDMFLELCIFLGCDYLEPIKGLGPKTAVKLLILDACRVRKGDPDATRMMFDAWESRRRRESIERPRRIVVSVSHTRHSHRWTEPLG